MSGIYVCMYIILRSLFFPGLSGLSGVSGSDGIRPERPFFDDVSPRNVSAVVGQAAVLRCRAKHIGNRTVRILNFMYLS
jgi:hypothetical protein